MSKQVKKLNSTDQLVLLKSFWGINNFQLLPASCKLFEVLRSGWAGTSCQALKESVELAKSICIKAVRSQCSKVHLWNKLSEAAHSKGIRAELG
mmetsp:Transcript_40390/g.70248  ORF Transcript_40390/g.70248 Transcript_40390/m.70248 type:complete len:94 (+) Transcript_40390:29-310(+)